MPNVQSGGATSSGQGNGPREDNRWSASGWHREAHYNREVYWHDDDPNQWYKRSEPDGETYTMEGFLYWLLKDDDWARMKEKYQEELAQRRMRDEAEWRKELERQEMERELPNYRQGGGVGAAQEEE